MKTVRIDIVSDVACPWCAIGYKRLEQAMTEVAGEVAVTIQWLPFQLNPELPQEGEPILDHLMAKYGRSAEEMEAAQAHMTELAHGLGLDFTRMHERRARNTFDAHRLLAWARERGFQTELSLALFDAYFGRAANVSDPAVLRGVVDAAGLPGDEAERILAGDDYAEQVRTEETRYKQAGITGVPAFILNQKYLVQGAQEPETLVAALREAADAEVATA